MLKRFLFWDYPRGSRPYDLMVGVILAFIFLTPRDFFRDQPRIPKASQITMLPSENGSVPFYVNADFLKNIPENQQVDRLTEFLRKGTGNRRLTVIRLAPIFDSEGELQAYTVFTRP
jgi:hypothetical protein